MINRKKKPCKKCGKDSFIFARGLCQWCYNKEYIEKTKEKLKTRSDADAKFYKYVWDNSAHECAECGKRLSKPDKGDARNYIHHILPKSKNKYYRHSIENTIILCWSCHQAAESAISYPKMKVFNECELIKEGLMRNVGLPYNRKMQA